MHNKILEIIKREMIKEKHFDNIRTVEKSTKNKKCTPLTAMDVLNAWANKTPYFKKYKKTHEKYVEIRDNYLIKRHILPEFNTFSKRLDTLVKEKKYLKNLQMIKN